jgi:hypothetical protein
MVRRTPTAASLTMHCSRRPSAAAECWTLDVLSVDVCTAGRWSRGAAIGGVVLRLLSGAQSHRPVGGGRSAGVPHPAARARRRAARAASCTLTSSRRPKRRPRSALLAEEVCMEAGYRWAGRSAGARRFWAAYRPGGPLAAFRARGWWGPAKVTGRVARPHRGFGGAILKHDLSSKTEGH